MISDSSYQLAGSVREVCEKVILGDSPEGILECDYKDTEFDLKDFYGSYIGKLLSEMAGCSLDYSFHVTG